MTLFTFKQLLFQSHLLTNNSQKDTKFTGHWFHLQNLWRLYESFMKEKLTKVNLFRLNEKKYFLCMTAASNLIHLNK